MFDWVLHSKTRVRMLKMFFKNPQNPLYGLEISQALKASPGTTHRELNALIKQNILQKKKEGALVLYNLNQSHPYFHELKKALFPKKRSQRIYFASNLRLSANTPLRQVAAFMALLDAAEEKANELVLLGDMIDTINTDVFETFIVHQELFHRLNSLANDIKVTYVPGCIDALIALAIGAQTSFSWFNSHIHFAHRYTNEKFSVTALHAAGLLEHQGYGDVLLKQSKIPAKLLQLQQKALKYHEAYAGKMTKELFHQAVNRYALDLKLSRSTQFTENIEMSAIDIFEETKSHYLVLGYQQPAAISEYDKGIFISSGNWGEDSEPYFVEIDKEGACLWNAAQEIS